MNYREAVLKDPVVPAGPHPVTLVPQKKQAVKVPKEKAKGNFSAAVINSCYGGFDVSDFAMQLYCQRYKKKYGKKYEGESGRRIGRKDPILIDLVREFPTQVSGEYSKLQIVYYPKKYDWFFRVSEYDGKEQGYIDETAYMLANIDRIASSALDADTKVKQIQAVLHDSYADAEVYKSLPTKGANFA